MASKWYGSIQNRLEENNDSVKEITVGTGMTEYKWSDREAYEVVAVRDQKHVTVRRLKHKHVGGEPYTNNWKLLSDETMPTYDLIKRGKYWYSMSTVTKADVENLDDEGKFRCALAGFDLDTVIAKGKQTKYHRWNVSFGHAQYYYDYEF